MKKLNYSWKVAGFALLFGLSMGLQSCDEIIDNPLSPVQPIPDTPAAPATPKATVAGTTITIENCKTTKDVNSLMSDAAVKKVFAETATLDDNGNTQTIEIIVKGGLETADAIEIPATSFDPNVQITFNDAFAKAEKDLAIKNNAANTNKFTVKLPDSESPINLDLTVNTTWDNHVIGNAVIGAVKSATTVADTWGSVRCSSGIKFKTFDPDKQADVQFYMSEGAVEAVILNGYNAATDTGGSWKECLKRGFRVDKAMSDEDNIFTPNAIIAEGTYVYLAPRSYESKAGTITIQKNAELQLGEYTETENSLSHYVLNVNSIVGADRSAKYINSQTEDYVWVDGNNKVHNVRYNIGSISNVTIPNFWGYLPSNVSNVTFGLIDNGSAVYLPSNMKSVSGIDFSCNVYIDVPVASTGMSTFTFENTNFGASSNRIILNPESEIYLTDASGNIIYVTVYVWQDKDGVIHTDTANPSGNAKFDFMIRTFERPAYDTVKYEDFKAFIAFVGCKVDGKALDSTLLSPMVTTGSFGTGSQVIYQIGYNSNYRLSDSGVLVAI
jgi:hypothetical protein